MVGAFGVPENASLQVNNASADAQAAVDGFVAEQNDDATALFTWDISVTDSNGASWQPDEYVRVVLEIPGERLHKHTPVYVVHVDDEGNVEKISAQVTQDGKISFYTNGFSTFAGFTVDFEYDGMPFSISGMSSMKRHNIPVTYAIIMAFCVPAYLVNKIADCNYMFLMRGDGTPYVILYNLVGGSPVLYPLGVILLFFVYIAAFYQVYFHVQAVLRRKKAAAMSGQA